MSKNIDKWKIDRLPTNGERIIGVVVGAIATIFCGGISVIWVLNKNSNNFNATEDAIYLVFFLFAGLSFWITLRAIFSNPKRPSKAAAYVTSIIILALSLIMLALGVLLDADANRIHMISIGLVGLGATLPIVQKGWRERNKT